MERSSEHLHKRGAEILAAHALVKICLYLNSASKFNDRLSRLISYADDGMSYCKDLNTLSAVVYRS